MIANNAVTDAATPSGANLRRGRASVIALWLTPIALAATVLTAGGSKLAGAPATWACNGTATSFKTGGTTRFHSDPSGKEVEV